MFFLFSLMGSQQKWLVAIFASEIIEELSELLISNATFNIIEKRKLQGYF